MELPACREKEDLPLAGTRLGILGQSGTGKSTVSVLLAHGLAERGYGVGLLDTDSRNVSLHRVLGVREPPTPLIEFFGGAASNGGTVTSPTDDPTPLSGAQVLLDALPEKFFRRSDDRLHLLSAGKFKSLGAACDGPISKIARDMELSGSGGPLVTLVDLNVGEDALISAVIANLDWAIVVVDPSPAGVQAVEDVRVMVQEARGETPPGHPPFPEDLPTVTEAFRGARVKGILVILNRVPDIRMEIQLAALVPKKPPINLIGSLRNDLTVGQAWLEGLPLHSSENKARVRGIIHRIEAAELSAGGQNDLQNRALPGFVA